MSETVAKVDGALYSDGRAVYVGNPDMPPPFQTYVAIRRMGNGDSYTFQLHWNDKVTSFTVSMEELHRALEVLPEPMWGNFA